jgi:uncharacterized protein (TIGR02284 family)
MKNSKVIDTLKSLMQLDVDASHAYTQAVESIDVDAIRDRLKEFRGDHERHVDDLSACIRRLGGKPPERRRDWKGFLIEGFTAVRGVTGTEGALKAMEGNEETTNRRYGDALAVEMPGDVRALVQHNYDDEKRHLAYVRDKIAHRAWEHAA